MLCRGRHTMTAGNVKIALPEKIEGACRTLVHALVTSQLDYGNGLLYGIPQVTIQRLQRIQNCAARLVKSTRTYEHITPVLRLLHWLPVRQRTLFKLLVFTYGALNATAPNYLVQLINHRNVTRTLRSGSSTELFFVPKSRTIHPIHHHHHH